jgi:phosphoglycerate dehydrogenase-like enzyme
MNILITGAWKCTKAQLEQIEALGHRVAFLQQEQSELPVPYTWVEAAICNGLFLYHPIGQFTNLRYIQLTSAGFDRVPMEYVKAHGIEIRNARGVYSIPMAEFALAGVLQLYKQGRFFAENQKRHRWEKHRGLLELYGKNVCVLGCGSVGTECARRFSAFGCQVTGVDIMPREDRNFVRILPLTALEQLLPEADIVVLTLPLTEESRHLIDDKLFSQMKNGTILVNIARGAIVEPNALAVWLAANRGAAVLDVFEEEPLPADSPLWDMENVILTPHNSFVGEGNGDRLFALIKNNLQELMI